jgi:polar amino acid transport system permease protein
VSLDLGLILANWKFLIVQGLLGIGAFGGGTVALAIPAIVLGFVLGIGVALARLSRQSWLYYPASLYVQVIRGIPLVMVVFWFWFFIPVATGVPLPQYWVALIAFVAFEGAYLGEIIRAGIQAVPRGQVEAAQATGLRYTTAMRRVVLPQAVRNMLPSLVTQFIILLKDTSLASIIGYMDLTKAVQTVNQREIRPFELYLFLAVVYWVLCYGMSLASRFLERRLTPSSGARDRRGLPVLAGGLALLLTGCTGALREDVARQDAAMADLRTRVDSLQADLRGVRQDLTALRGTLDSGFARAAQARETEDRRVREAQDAMGERLAQAERRVEDMAEGVTGLEASVAGLAEQFARLEAGNVGASTFRRASPSGPRQAGPPMSAEELFDRGMESFRAGELGQAVLDFAEFAEKHPTHPLAASAHFWIGEAYFRSRDFEHAAGEYQKAIDLAPAGERTPDALLRLGLALRSLRREDRAREVWARLVRDFPESEAALRARAVLRQPGRTVRPAEPR